MHVSQRESYFWLHKKQPPPVKSKYGVVQVKHTEVSHVSQRESYFWLHKMHTPEEELTTYEVEQLVQAALLQLVHYEPNNWLQERHEPVEFIT